MNHTAALQHLGGSKFLAMTGAKSFTYTENDLAFVLPPFPHTKINFVRLTVENDLYKITFSRIWGRTVTKIAEESEILNEDLQRTFKRHTGLDTHL